VTSNSVATVESLFGNNGRRVADSMKIPTQRIRAKYDSLGMPVAAFDAIFLPISSLEEIGIVTSQLRYFNFQAQLLGNGNWYEPNELEQQRQYCNGINLHGRYYWMRSTSSINSSQSNFDSSSQKILPRIP